MKLEDVLRFANESGLTCVLNADRISYTDWANRMINFAQLVEEQEREACARVCDNKQYVHPYHDLGTLIRARGEAWTS